MAFVKWVGQVLAYGAGLGVVWMAGVFLLSGQWAIGIVFAGLSMLAYTIWQRVRETQSL